jgi:hypothetical protein
MRRGLDCDGRNVYEVIGHPLSGLKHVVISRKVYAVTTITFKRSTSVSVAKPLTVEAVSVPWYSEVFQWVL